MKIAPSLLSCDFSKMGEEIERMDLAGADWMHLDVMDGHFVPNITFGAPVIKAVRKFSNRPFDVHLMISDPLKYIDDFADAGADIITFHLEAVKDMDACLELCRKIRAMGVQAGVSVKPKTGVEGLLAHLKEIDLILIMSVEPGFGGQSFMEDTLEKVRVLRAQIEKEGLDTRIEIDGGINKETAKLAVAAGVDTLVAGSYVFKNGIAEAVDALLACQG